MNRRLYLLPLVFVLCITGSLKAQSGYKQYNHKVIAILPFATNANGKKAARKDTSVDQTMERDIKFALQVQEAMYNAFVQDSANLVVTVQDWRVTDSLLRMAGVNLRKVNFMDQRVIAVLLKVDAVVSGSLNRVSTYKSAPSTVGNSSLPVTYQDKHTALFVNLYDGETGEEIWQFDDTVYTSLLMSQKTGDNRLYKRLLKKMPYHL
ncbi:hypothetical protein F0L74_07685 [Chitinophaga agrisoli]|uniref:Uncharacterized protein n=1 Tax=Chitinophaga agrisoli TaxID=2607653 RepID=A0A5B2VWI0_9BACT|nr:hypothetical protein [Chitinophaga agrisoli]KAA2242419.1 hypothetical protein F0L74_07685 [Chitinophaga agrisoli]